MALKSDPRYEEIASASLARMAAGLPRTLSRAVRLGWAADRTALRRMLVAQLLAAAAAALALAATTSLLTHLLVTDHSLPDRLHAALPSLAVAAAALAGRALADNDAQATAARLAPKVVRAADTATLRAATAAELAAYDQPGFETALAASEKGAESTQDLVTDSQALTSALAQIVAAASIATALHPLLLPLLLLAVTPRGLAAVSAARIEHRTAYRTLSDERLRSVLRSYTTDRTTAAEVRAATMDTYLLGLYQQLSDRIEAENTTAIAQASRIRLLGAAGTGLGMAVAWTTLGLLAATGHIDLAVAGTAVIALRAAAAALAQLVATGARLFRTSLYLQDWDTFLTQARQHAATRGDLSAPSTGPDTIRAANLTYAYPGADRPALDDITLELHRGEIVALVGENGSGKTTLATLLTGLLLPTTGTVAWDDTQLADIDPRTLWQQVAMVPQTYTRFPLAARENITLGQPRGPGDDLVLAAAHAAGADTTIEALPHGLDTLLARPWWGGHELSGGHWQRLAVARAFYRNAPVLILDEPTSALDARAEHQVFTRLRALASGRTTLFVTHRLANARAADRIVVLEGGRVHEQGTFEELLDSGGSFAQMYKLQQDA